MNLNLYLEKIREVLRRDEQKKWFERLKDVTATGRSLYKAADTETRHRLYHEFLNRVRTEEIKAWYSAPEGDSLFQGTSISSLTIPYEIPSPLRLKSVEDLEAGIADAYIELHDKHAGAVRKAILENVDGWLSRGLYYCVAISSKLVSQAFGLIASHDDVVFKISGRLVDPHEITSYPDSIRAAYFKECLKRVEIFKELGLERRELESSIVLADISKPKIKNYTDKIILAPVRCNEIASILSERVIAGIIKKTSGRIRPESLAVVIYDTDTPYTYYRIMGHDGSPLSPDLPGLIVLGSSGTIDAFRWLYTYRVSLIAQKMMKSSLYSEAHRRFMPFVFFGVLVPRDAEILLDMKNLHRLRYRGNIAPDVEFAYLIPSYIKSIKSSHAKFSWKDFADKHSIK